MIEGIQHPSPVFFLVELKVYGVGVGVGKGER